MQDNLIDAYPMYRQYGSQRQTQHFSTTVLSSMTGITNSWVAVSQLPYACRQTAQSNQIPSPQ